jgi:hypothetical protein
LILLDSKQNGRSSSHVSSSILLFCILLLNLFCLLSFPSVANKENLHAGREDLYTVSSDGAVTYASDGSPNTVEFSSVDTAEVINAVIDALPVYGGRIYLKAGNYTVSAPLVLSKPCFIEGEGSGRSHPAEGITQISFGNTTGFRIVSAGVRVSHLQLRGCGETFTGCYGIHLDASSSALNQNIDIEDVMIADTYYAIYGTGAFDIWNLYLSDVYINYCDQGIRIDKTVGAVQLQTNHVIITHASSDAVYLTRVDAVILESIYFVEPGGNGIVIASCVSYPIMIRNCQIDECHGNGILLDFENPCSLWLTVTDTQIKAYKSAIYMRNAQDVIISNCHIATSQLSESNQTIVYLEDAYRVQLNDCLIKNLSDQTRNCVELNDSRYCQVEGCQIDHSIGKAENVDFAIKETGTESKCNQIINNICVGISNGPTFIYGSDSISENNV